MTAGAESPVLEHSTGTLWSWSPIDGDGGSRSWSPIDGDGGSLIKLRARLTPAGDVEQPAGGGWPSTETRDRVRAALINSGELWPTQPVQVELEPATTQQSLLDAALAVSVLAATGAVPGRGVRPVVVGELGLDGRLRATAAAAANIAAAAGAVAALPVRRRRLVVPAGLVLAGSPQAAALPAASPAEESARPPPGRRRGR